MITPGSIVILCLVVIALMFGFLVVSGFVHDPVAWLDWALPHRRIVNCDHDVYLHRWYIFRTKYVSLFLHKFVRSDEDRALHDHPWSFFVIPIWRGYIEHTEYQLKPGDNPDDSKRFPKLRTVSNNDGNGFTRYAVYQRRVYPIISARYRPALFRHRVELLPNKKQFDVMPLPAWSLFFHFTKEREWGFHPPQGFVNWRDWWSSHKCGDEPE